MKRIWICAALLVAGCQSYQPMPLDTEGHLEDWQARDPAAASVVEYASRLNDRDSGDRGPFDIRDGVGLAEAEVVTLFFNPGLRVQRLEAGVELAGAREAGRWEDPELNVSGAWVLGNVDHPLIAGGGIGFTIPLSGRPGVEQDLAYAQYGAAHRRVVQAEWETLLELRREWIEYAALRERITLTESLIADVEGVQGVADALFEAGELTAIDSRVFRLEVASQRLELQRLNNRVETAELRLRELMGLHPRAEVELLPTMRVGDELPDDTQTRLIENNPFLETRRAEYDAAEQELRLEIRKQYPDLSIGPTYEFEGGQSRIGLGLGLPIPIINLNKEGIARARAHREAVAATFHAGLERLIHELERAQVDFDRARERATFVREELAPLADEQVEDAMTLAELGEFDASLQLDALTRRHDARLRILESALHQYLARERLTALMGPSFKPEPREDEDE